MSRILWSSTGRVSAEFDIIKQEEARRPFLIHQKTAVSFGPLNHTNQQYTPWHLRMNHTHGV